MRTFSLISLIKILVSFVAFVATNVVFAQNFSHEIFGSASYTMGSGSEKVDSNSKKIVDNEMSASLGYGYFMENKVEPVVEFEMISSLSKTGEFSSKRSLFGWAAGAYFNVVSEEEAAIPTTEKKKARNRLNPWIPYGGFLLTSKTDVSSTGSASKEKLSDGSLITKVVFGTRYMLFSNVALNSWVRLSYQNVSSKATSEAEETAKTTKLLVELKLISFSILF